MDKQSPATLKLADDFLDLVTLDVTFFSIAFWLGLLKNSWIINDTGVTLTAKRCLGTINSLGQDKLLRFLGQWDSC